MRQWRELAAWRKCVDIDADAKSTAGTEHRPDSGWIKVTKIFKLYLEDVKRTLRLDQFDQKWTYYKSCVEVILRREAASRQIAYAIWDIGLPRLPPFATQQRGKQSSKEELEAVPEAIHKILSRIDLLTYALIKHKVTWAYETTLRKSGMQHGQTGLILQCWRHERRYAKPSFSCEWREGLQSNGATQS